MILSRLFAGVVNMSVTASVVILVIVTVRLALKKAPKIFSYALWWVVLLRLLCPVAIPLPSLAVPESPAPVPAAVSSQDIGENVQGVVSGPEMAESPVKVVPQEIPPVQQEQRELETLFPLAAFLWLIGAVSMMLLGTVSTLRFRQRLRGSCRLGDNVYLTDHLESAFVAGLFYPKIYLPSDLPQKQIPYIWAHEQHHIARLDHVVKHLYYFALCLHWFNPLVWLAFSLMGRDMEMSCDEAVLKKLGSHIRADYSASLLQLATGRRSGAGTALCFGEGDAKGRIRNLARWKQPKKWQCLFCLILCAAILTACATSPARQVVKPQEMSLATTAETNGEVYEETILSDDGSTTYHLRFDPAASQMPSTVEAIPRPITSGDMERVARALLGDVPFYEKEPTSNPQYSRQQYQQMIDHWEPYLASGEMTALFGVNQGSDRLEELKHQLDKSRKALSAAPENNPLTPCDWTLKKERVYNDCEWEIDNRPENEDGDWLVATAEKDGLGYTYMVIQDDTADYRLRRYLLQLGGASLYPTMDRKPAWAKLCRTEPPTNQQLQDIQSRVLELLGRMEFGHWAVSSTQVEVDSSVYPYEYQVRVCAAPVIFGAPVVLEERVTEDSGKAEGIIPYLPTKAEFLMSPNGVLLDMELDTPIDVKEASAVSIPSFDQLMDLARETLSAQDHYLAQKYDEPFPEPLVCDVYLNQASYSMVSVNDPESKERIFYCPRLLLRGEIEFRGTDSGEIYYRESSTFACPGYPEDIRGYVMHEE